MGDLVKRDGIYYKKFSDVPFTGKTTGKSQGSFKNGKRDGPWVSYHGNGQLKSKGNWRDGKKEGPWVNYSKNGEVSHKAHFKDRKQTVEGDQLWLFRRDFVYTASGIKVPNREVLILSKNGKYYSGSVGGFGHYFQDRLNVICPKNMIPSSLTGDENLFSKNSYIDVFLEGNFYQKDVGVVLSEPKHLGYNVPDIVSWDRTELPKPSLCIKDIYELDESKLESIYSSPPKESGNRVDKMSLFYRDAIFHIPSIMAETENLLLKKTGGFLDGGFFPSLPKQYLQSSSYLTDGDVSDIPPIPPMRLQFKGPFSMKSAYQAYFLLEIFEERRETWGCLVDAIDQHNKTSQMRKKPYRLEKLISALGGFYDLGIGAPDVESLSRYHSTFRNASDQEIAELSQDLFGNILPVSNTMPIYFDEGNRRRIQLLRNDKNIRSLYPEYFFSEIYVNAPALSVKKLKEIEFKNFNRLIRTQEFENFKIALNEFLLSSWDIKESLKELVLTAPKSSCGIDDMYMYFNSDKFEIEKIRTINSLMIEDLSKY